jgi:hypothetical protein
MSFPSDVLEEVQLEDNVIAAAENVIDVLYKLSSAINEVDELL